KLKRDGPDDADHSAVVRPIRLGSAVCVFKDTDINTYTDAVISKCIDDVIQRITVRRHSPIRSPGLTEKVRAKLKARTDAYNSGDLEEYRKSRYTHAPESHQQRKETVQGQSGVSLQGLQQPGASVEVQKAQEDHCPPVISRADVCRTLKRINTRKAPGPDGIPGRALKVCADQLADVFADIFNVSLLQSVVPTCFKETIIVPVPKKTKILSLNDYRPVALTSTIMKCFERLVKLFITSSILDSLDPLQFAYRPNRSTEDAIALTLHTALSHLDQRDTYVRMLFIDYSSAFNTIVPSKLTPGCADGQHHILHPDSEHRHPQGCVLSPLLYSLFTHDCVATHSSNTIIKFADDMTVIGLITGDDETAYREEVRALTSWCQDNNLHLNVSKTKELIVDFRRRQREGTRPPLHQRDYGGESQQLQVPRGSHQLRTSTWTHHTDFITKSARQRLFFLRMGCCGGSTWTPGYSAAST
ncbi:hypothetical protein L3Q82_012229, partial [Scortum barcoo]